MSDNSDIELIVQQEGSVVQVTMNRPAVLNALSLEMIRILSAKLPQWEEDDSVKAVFIKGSEDRAFCAGGDVKSTYRTGLSYRRGEVDERIVSLFYGEEYCLNRQLFHFKKPTFSFMSGITMGGGFGIAGPCSHRIAAENTVFAMPEVAIGFFPDVGSTYFLNRCPGEAGTYLALTGGRIAAEDMMFCGLASHYIPLGQQQACQQQLREVVAGGGDVDSVLAAFQKAPEKEGNLQKNRAIVDECFRGNDVQAIIDSLRASEDLWAAQQADVIEGRSPLSLKVSLAHLRMAKNMDFDEVTAQDFVLSQHFMKGHDFYEGVRAVLVDKDQQPQWEPGRLDEITSDMVHDYFRPAGMSLDEIAA